MKTSLVLEPVGNVVSLDDVKTHLRVDHVKEDAYIQSLIQSATAYVENITRRKLLTQTWMSYHDDWPQGGFVMPHGRLKSITSIKYRDSSNVEYTWAATEYLVDIVNEPGRVVLGYSKTYPNETLLPLNPIYIQFICGFGDDDDVPHPIKTAIMLVAADMYANRESIVIGKSVAEIPAHIMNLLWPYRVWVEA